MSKSEVPSLAAAACSRTSTATVPTAVAAEERDEAAPRATLTGSLPAATNGGVAECAEPLGASASATVTFSAAGQVTARAPRTAADSAVQDGCPGVTFLSTTGTPGTSWGLGGLHAACTGCAGKANATMAAAM